MVPHHLLLMIICHNQMTMLPLLCVPVQRTVQSTIREPNPKFIKVIVCQDEFDQALSV